MKYKLYKSGKFLVTGVAFVGTLVGLQAVSFADTTATADSSSVNQTSSTVQKDTPQVTQAQSYTNPNMSYTPNIGPTKVQMEKQYSEQATAKADQQQALKNQQEAAQVGSQEDNVLKEASGYHIYANKVTAQADTNGNIATKDLDAPTDFGTRNGDDTYYIGNISGTTLPNSFRGDTNKVTVGSDVLVNKKGDQVSLNGVTQTNLKADDVTQDDGTAEKSFDTTMSSLKVTASYLAKQETTSGVTVNLDDRNNQVIDVTKAQDTNGYIYVDVPWYLLCNPQPIKIYANSGQNTIVFNVRDVPEMNVETDNTWTGVNTQIEIFMDGASNALPSAEEHAVDNIFLWNFGTTPSKIDFYGGRFMGSILAPNANLRLGVNVDGNIVANYVWVEGGESHRWDLVPGTPTDPSEPKTPTEPENPTEPETPETPTEPEEPETPTNPETPEVPTTPEFPTTPSTPDTPVTPEVPTTDTPKIPSTETKAVLNNKVPSYLTKTVSAKVAQKQAEQETNKVLPQTGNTTAWVAIYTGIVLLGTALTVAFYSIKRRFK